MVAISARYSRVTIREWSRRDRRAIAKWPRPVAPAHWLQAEPSESKRSSYAIEFPRQNTQPGDRRLVGRITLRDQTAESARIGIYLHPDLTGRGLGREALQAFCAMIFETGLQRLQLDVAADNTRALRCYLASGFLAVSISERHGHRYIELERSR